MGGGGGRIVLNFVECVILKMFFFRLFFSWKVGFGGFILSRDGNG